MKLRVRHRTRLNHNLMITGPFFPRSWHDRRVSAQMSQERARTIRPEMNQWEAAIRPRSARHLGLVMSNRGLAALCQLQWAALNYLPALGKTGQEGHTARGRGAGGGGGGGAIHDNNVFNPLVHHTGVFFIFFSHFQEKPMHGRQKLSVCRLFMITQKVSKTSPFKASTPVLPSKIWTFHTRYKLSFPYRYLFLFIIPNPTSQSHIPFPWFLFVILHSFMGAAYWIPSKLF